MPTPKLTVGDVATLLELAASDVGHQLDDDTRVALAERMVKLLSEVTVGQSLTEEQRWERTIAEAARTGLIRPDELEHFTARAAPSPAAPTTPPETTRPPAGDQLPESRPKPHHAPRPRAKPRP